MSAFGSPALPAASPTLGSAPSAVAHTQQDAKLTPREALEASKQKEAFKGALPCLFLLLQKAPPAHSPPPLIRQPVVVRFKATGNAPIMKQNFYKISSSNQFRTVIAFLRKELGWKPSDSLVRTAFTARGMSKLKPLRAPSSSTSTRPSRPRQTTR